MSRVLGTYIKKETVKAVLWTGVEDRDVPDVIPLKEENNFGKGVFTPPKKGEYHYQEPARIIPADTVIMEKENGEKITIPKDKFLADYREVVVPYEKGQAIEVSAGGATLQIAINRDQWAINMQMFGGEWFRLHPNDLPDMLHVIKTAMMNVANSMSRPDLLLFLK